MSHYIGRHCEKHGEWDEDVDNPSDCPKRNEEAKIRMAHHAARLKEIVGLLTDPENQPHQYVGDFEGLLSALAPSTTPGREGEKG